MAANNRLSQMRPNAWLLDFGGGCRAAVGTRVLVHLIDQPETFAVPCTPSYCRSVMFWEDRLLPVMDLAARLEVSPPQEPKLLAVACYQEPSGEGVRYGALQLSASPIPIAVSDAVATHLPEQPAGWDKLAISCFDYEGMPIPILHLGRVFS